MNQKKVLRNTVKKTVLCLAVLAGIGAFSALPCLAATTPADDTTEVNVEFTNPITSNTLDQVISNLIDFAFTIVLVIAVIAILVGAFFIVSSSGDPKKVEQGKQIVWWALIAVGIVLLAKGFVILLRALLGVKKS